MELLPFGVVLLPPVCMWADTVKVVMTPGGCRATSKYQPSRFAQVPASKSVQLDEMSCK